jgi:hypothetical protein
MKTFTAWLLTPVTVNKDVVKFFAMLLILFLSVTYIVLSCVAEVRERDAAVKACGNYRMLHIIHDVSIFGGFFGGTSEVICATGDTTTAKIIYVNF